MLLLQLQIRRLSSVSLGNLQFFASLLQTVHLKNIQRLKVSILQMSFLQINYKERLVNTFIFLPYITCDKELKQENNQKLLSVNIQIVILIKTIKQIINFESDDSQVKKQIQIYMKQIIRKELNQNQYYTSIQILQLLIQSFNQQGSAQVFYGLGSKQEEIGFSEGYGYSWYQKRYKNISIYDQLAICHLLNKNNHSSKQSFWYRLMYQKKPNSFQILFGLALSEHNEGNNSEALTLYKKLIKMNNAFPKTYQLIAFINLNEQKYLMSSFYAKKCLQLDNLNIFAQVILIRSLHHKNLPILRQCLLNILQKEPSFAIVYCFIGNSYIQEDQIDVGVQYYLKGYNMNQHSLHLRINYARWLHNYCKYDEVISLLSNINYLNLSQYERTWGYSCLACSYFQLGYYDCAIYWFERSINENCENKVTINIYLYALHRTGKYEQMLKYVEQVRRKYQYIPAFQEVRLPYFLVCAHYNLKNYETAIQIGKTIPIINSTIIMLDLWRYIAYSFVKINKPRESIQWYLKCFNLSLKNGISNRLRYLRQPISVLEKDKDYEEAFNVIKLHKNMPQWKMTNYQAMWLKQKQQQIIQHILIRQICDNLLQII